MAVNPIPEGFHAITPYLVIRGVSDLIEYLRNAGVQDPAGNQWWIATHVEDDELQRRAAER